MPLYRFAVHNSHRHDDPEGTELFDDGAARDEALKIIRDMTRNNEPSWKGWSIEVTEGGRRVWQIPFTGGRMNSQNSNCSN
jgi:hypothetical protein